MAVTEAKRTRGNDRAEHETHEGRSRENNDLGGELCSRTPAQAISYRPHVKLRVRESSSSCPSSPSQLQNLMVLTFSR